eukprot:1750316-Rhodomonas_salina.1
MTRFQRSYGHALKSDYPQVYDKFVTDTGTTPGIFRSDNAPEILQLRDRFAQDKTRHETSNPGKQFQNAVAESCIRYTSTRARTQLVHANMPLFFWEDSWHASDFLENVSKQYKKGSMIT